MLLEQLLWGWPSIHPDFFGLVKLAPLVLVALGLGIGLFEERRSRHAWRKALCTVEPAGAGPYRTASLPRYFDAAPLFVRSTALLGVCIGALGVGWVSLVVVEVFGHGHSMSALLGVVGAMLATSSGMSSYALFHRRKDVLSNRMTKGSQALAVVCVTVALAYLVGAFDKLPVEVYGIKWHETRTLGIFLRGPAGVVSCGHFAITWRLILGACAVFTVLHSAQALLARVASRGQLRNG